MHGNRRSDVARVRLRDVARSSARSARGTRPARQVCGPDRVTAGGPGARDATFLNDVAIGPDGAVYVTDTGIRFDAAGNMTHPGANRVFRIQGDSISEAATGDALQSPNGIAWDQTRGRWIVAPFGGNALLTLAPGAAVPDTLARGPGEYDGVVVLDDGRILVTSWADSAVFMVAGDSMRAVVPNVSAPADIGFDARRRVLAVPRFESNTVEFYRLP